MKPSTLPEFAEGVHYRQQHPTKEAARRWRFVSLVDRMIVPDGIEDIMEDRRTGYYDAKGQQWMVIDRRGIKIRAGYAWNGCSPKKWVWPFGWTGTPDYQSTILASMFHDSLYQFARTTHFPFNRSDVDALFYHTIAMSGSPRIAGIYHGAVRKCSSWSGRPKNGEYSKLAILP